MSLVARVVEEMGIPTMVIGSARDMIAQVRPPRAVFVNFPLGHQTGKPSERELQRSILLDALKAFETIEEPGTILDLPYEWGEPFDYLPQGYNKSYT